MGPDKRFGNKQKTHLIKHHFASFHQLKQSKLGFKELQETFNGTPGPRNETSIQGEQGLIWHP